MGKRANLVKANQTPLKQNLNVLFTDHDHHHHRYHWPSWYRTLCFRYIIRLVCVLTFSHFYHGRCIAAVLPAYLCNVEEPQKRKSLRLEEVYLFVISCFLPLSISLSLLVSLRPSQILDINTYPYRFAPFFLAPWVRLSSLDILCRNSVVKKS